MGLCGAFHDVCLASLLQMNRSSWGMRKSCHASANGQTTDSGLAAPLFAGAQNAAGNNPAPTTTAPIIARQRNNRYDTTYRTTAQTWKTGTGRPIRLICLLARIAGVVSVESPSQRYSGR
jgi:hypothetical protein